MKFAMTTDTHYGHSSSTHKIHLKFLKRLKYKMEEEEIKYLIHCGDWASSKQNELQRTWMMFRKELGSNIKILTVLGNHDCLDKKTELLTKRGWLNYKDILISDSVLSLNKEEKSEWTNINNIIIKKAEKIYDISNQNIDMSITENHRIFCSKRSSSKEFEKLRYYTLKDLTKSRYRFPLSGYNDNPEYPITDDQIKLLAWIFTDGSRSRGCQIWQSKIKFVKEIRELLNKLKYKFSENSRERDIKEICGKKLKKKPLPQYCFNIFAESQGFITKWIDKNRKPTNPDYFNLFSNRQLILFIKGLISGDGSYCSSSPFSGAIDGEKTTLDWFQSLAVQCGTSASISEYREGNFRLNFTFNRLYSQIEDPLKEIVKKTYNDTVWCLSVPFTNFMVRRNNKAYFTGNCWDQPSYGTPLATRKYKTEWMNGMPYGVMRNNWVEWAGDSDIWLLEDSPVKTKDTVFFGFNGWYNQLPVNTNDKNYMPKFHESVPIDNYLSWKASKDIDKCIRESEAYRIKDKSRKHILVTHHPSYTFQEHYRFMCANSTWMPHIAEEFDAYCVGHSHQIENWIYKSDKGSVRCINAGTNRDKSHGGHGYDAPNFLIIDTEEL